MVYLFYENRRNLEGIEIGSTLLIVDDDADIREMLGNYFAKENYKVDFASNGKEGLYKAKQQEYDTILLDIMMPEMDGYTMLSKLREFSDVPVILLTAKGEQMAKIKGFTKGCDDYVMKPFDLAELSFRIQAIQRRTKRNGNFPEKEVISVKDIRIDTKAHVVYKKEEEIPLTPKEYEILCLLASNKGRVYSTKTLYEQIWKDSFMENDKSVITHIRNLRGKIGDNAKEGTYIKTIWGVGYKIEKED